MSSKHLSVAWQITPKELPGDVFRRLLLRLPGGAISTPPGSSPRHRAIIYEAQRLGDFLLAVKSIRILLDYFGEEHSALAVSPEAMPLAIESFPKVAKFAVPLFLAIGGWDLFGGLRLRRGLSAHSCDHLVCLRHHRSPLATSILGWIPANERWAIVSHPWMSPGARAAEDRLFDHTAAFPFQGEEGVPLEVQASARLLSMVTGFPHQAEALLPSIDLDQVHPADSGSASLVVAPWGSSHMKSIPEKLLTGVLKKLSEHAFFSVDVVTAPFESDKTHVLTGRLRKSLPGMDVVDRLTPLGDLTGVISSATAVLACDSFVGHLATALDRPTAVLATGASPGLFGGWSRSGKQRWFTREMACWGCGWRCAHSHPRCLHEIPPGDVADFLLPSLTGKAVRL
ncbi:MAG: glycosyltransferase family 9 protein [Thermodesulfobacteriota bacterium]